MIKKLNLKIINIDHDGNAEGKIFDNAEKKCVDIPFSKDNPVFSIGDIVSVFIKKKKR